MKGKITFTRHEAEIIRQTLDQVRRADRATQKRLRHMLRGSMSFYVSDFASSNSGFTPADFDKLVKCGTITIL
jgi:hypothetical protein